MVSPRYTSTEDLSTRLHTVEADFYGSLEGLKDRLDELEKIKMAETGFTSFQLDYKTMPFSETFEVTDSKGAKNGPSSWGYTESAVGGHPNAVGQSSPIAGRHAGQGTFALLKGHRFYDTVLTANLYVSPGKSRGQLMSHRFIARLRGLAVPLVWHFVLGMPPMGISL